MSCRNDQKNTTTKPIEWTSESIREQRREYGRDFLPWHNKGVLDRGAVDRYGAVAVKKRGFSDSEIRNAKYQWNSESYYKE